MFNKKIWNNKGMIPPYPSATTPDCLRPSTLAGTVVTNLVTKLRDMMTYPITCVHCMPPGSVIVSGVEYDDHIAHTANSTATHNLPLSDRSKSDCHLYTSVALFPQCRMSVPGRTAFGEAQVEMFHEVVLKQGEVLIMVSTARHHGPPPPLA